MVNVDVDINDKHQNDTLYLGYAKHLANTCN